GHRRSPLNSGTSTSLRVMLARCRKLLRLDSPIVVGASRACNRKPEQNARFEAVVLAPEPHRTTQHVGLVGRRGSSLRCRSAYARSRPWPSKYVCSCQGYVGLNLGAGPASGATVLVCATPVGIGVFDTGPASSSENMA